MNKEKEDICYGGLKGYGKTYCEMIRLQQENKELHNKIDKVIKYIEAEGTTFLNFAGQRTWCGKHDADRILKILKDMM